MREHQIVISLKPEQFLKLQQLARAAGAKSMGMFVRQTLVENLGLDGAAKAKPAPSLASDKLHGVIDEIKKLHADLHNLLDSSQSGLEAIIEIEKETTPENPHEGAVAAPAADIEDVLEDLAERTFAISPRLGGLSLGINPLANIWGNSDFLTEPAQRKLDLLSEEPQDTFSGTEDNGSGAFLPVETVEDVLQSSLPEDEFTASPAVSGLVARLIELDRQAEVDEHQGQHYFEPPAEQLTSLSDGPAFSNAAEAGAISSEAFAQTDIVNVWEGDEDVEEENGLVAELASLADHLEDQSVEDDPLEDLLGDIEDKVKQMGAELQSAILERFEETEEETLSISERHQQMRKNEDASNLAPGAPGPETQTGSASRQVDSIIESARQSGGPPPKRRKE